MSRFKNPKRVLSSIGVALVVLAIGVSKIASKIAAKFKCVSLPGKGGVAVFAGGQDAPSEALFAVGKNRYLVEALGNRAARFASEMTPAS